jgi:hypothetical protein
MRLRRQLPVLATKDCPSTDPLIPFGRDFPGREVGGQRCARCGKPVTGGWARGRWGNHYAYYYCRQKCSGVITRKAVLEEQFVGLLPQLVPSPEWLELLKQTILSIWHDELGQVSDVRESVNPGYVPVLLSLGPGRRLETRSASDRWSSNPINLLGVQRVGKRIVE